MTEERLDLRVDLRRLDARRDLVDLVRRFDREVLLRRRLEVVGDFFLATRETPIGAIIAQRSLYQGPKMPTVRPGEVTRSDFPGGEGNYKRGRDQGLGIRDQAVI